MKWQTVDPVRQHDGVVHRVGTADTPSGVELKHILRKNKPNENIVRV